MKHVIGINFTNNMLFAEYNVITFCVVTWRIKLAIMTYSV
jgi:hypothetical protein